MFDYFLFERYSLSEKEENQDKIHLSLEAKKKADGWEAFLKAPNERKRVKAVESKKKWEEDCEILLNPEKRKAYLNELLQKMSILIDSIEDEGEEYFDTFALAEDITVEEAKSLYEKYKSADFDGREIDATEAINVAILANNVAKEFDNLTAKLKPQEKESLQANNVNTESLAHTLKLDSCLNVSDVRARAKEVCNIVYEIYNKQLLSPEFQKGCFEILSEGSKGEGSINRLLADESFEKHLKTNNWILFRYIKNTCLLMKRKRISSDTAFANIPAEDVADFANALKEVFGVNVTVKFSSDSNSPSEPKIPQEELKAGLSLLQKGDFERAKIHFRNQAQIDPYSWKAYWGLFKCELGVVQDTDIYFPGFTHDLKQSYLTDVCPEYIDYYKTAKFNAAAARSTEINFNTVELEYSKADRINESYESTVDGIVKNYEKLNADKIKSDKAKGLIEKIKAKQKEYKKWRGVHENGLVVPGMIFLIMAIFANAVIFPLTTHADLWWLPMVLIVVLPLILGIILGTFFNGFVGFIVTAAGIGAPIGMIAFLEILASEIGETGAMAVYYLVFGIPVVVTALLFVTRTRKYLVSNGKMKSIHSDLEKLSEAYGNCCFAELEDLYSDPIISKYNIPFKEIQLDISRCFVSKN